MSPRFPKLLSLAVLLVSALLLAPKPAGAQPGASAAAAPERQQEDLTLFVEPISTEWLERLLPPLLEKLIRVAPYRVAWSSSDDGLRAVAASTRQLALMRRSSALAFKDSGAVEWFELGPATCMALVVRQDAPWTSYGDLNYASQGRLSIDVTSQGARDYVERLNDRFPLAIELDTRVRPSLIAVQRLAAKDIDLVVMDVPRRDDAAGPPQALHVLQERGLRLLDVPDVLIRHSARLIPGEILVAQGSWPWSEPTTYRTLCDPYVLVMPAASADRLVYSLHQVLTSTGESLPPISPVLMSALGPPPEAESLSTERSKSASPVSGAPLSQPTVPPVAVAEPTQIETSAPAEVQSCADATNSAQADPNDCDPAVPYVFTDGKSGARLELARCVEREGQRQLLPAPELSNDLVRMVQRHLNDLGFNSGRVDGVIGPRTRGAIRRFQVSEGIAANRLVSFELLERLERFPAPGSRSAQVR